MIYKLAKPIRQALAVALLFVAVGAILLLVVLPVTAKIADLRDRIEQERTIAGRLTTAASGGTDGTPANQQRNVVARMRALFLEGESEPIRIAAIQGRLIEVLGARQVTPRSTRNLPGQERSNLRLAGVQLHFVSSIETLQAILLDIESHKPMFLIESLHVTAAAQSGGAAGEERGMLETRLDVYGVEAPAKPQ